MTVTRATSTPWAPPRQHPAVTATPSRQRYGEEFDAQQRKLSEHVLSGGPNGNGVGGPPATLANPERGSLAEALAHQRPADEPPDDYRSRTERARRTLAAENAKLRLGSDNRAQPLTLPDQQG